MNQVEIAVMDGRVLITQNRDLDGEQDVVRLHPDQIPLLAKWLAQAAVVAMENINAAGQK